MKDQHEKIKTYRNLNQAEINIINEIKALEAKVNTLLDRLYCVHESDKRCNQLAADNLETGFMYLIKSITKPERLSE